MGTVRYLTVAMGMMTIISCAKNSKPLANDVAAIKKANAPFERNQLLYNSAYAYCGKNDDCPSSLALYLTLSPRSSGMCTSFLIAPTLAMTASHCIAADSTQSKLLFPETVSAPEKSVTVKRVVFKSDINQATDGPNGKRADYALLELNEAATGRDAISISQEGIPDGTDLHVYAFKPESDTSMTAALQGTHCTAMMNSAAQPSYDQAFSSIVSLGKCKIENGNSGAPAIDAAGKVRAVLQAELDPDQVKKIEDETTVDTVGSMALASNIACMQLTGVASPASEACNAKVPNVNLIDGLHLLVKKSKKAPTSDDLTNSALVQAFNDWQEKDGKTAPISWILSASDDGWMTPMPVCFTTLPTSGNFLVNAPRWRAYPSIDESLRISTAVETSEDTAMNAFSFSLPDLTSQGKVMVSLSDGTNQKINSFALCNPPLPVATPPPLP